MRTVSASVEDELVFEIEQFCKDAGTTTSQLIRSLLKEKISGQPSLTTIYEDIHSRFNQIDTKFFATYAALEGLCARTLQIYIATQEQSENTLRLFFSGKPMPGDVVTYLGTLQSLKNRAMEEYSQKTAEINERNAKLEQIESQQKNASKEGSAK